jgi:anti-sigma factor RsiW
MDHLTAQKLVEYLEGELPAAQAAQVTEHLAGCGDCEALAGRVRRSADAFDAWTASVKRLARDRRAAARLHRRGEP